MTQLSFWLMPLSVLLFIDSLWARWSRCASTPEYQRLDDQVFPTAVGEVPVWSECDVPNPLADWRGCGRNSTGWLCDPDGLLDDQEFNDIDTALNQSMATTRCRCEAGCSKVPGHPMLVMIVDWLRMPDMSSQSCISGSCGMVFPQLLPGSRGPTYQEWRVALRNFGDHVRERWSVGHCQDEVVIIVTTRYRKLWVSAGHTVAARLGDMLTEEMEAVEEDIQQGHVARAILHLVDAYTDRLASTNTWALPLGITFVVLAGLALVFGAVITAVFCRYELSQGKTCGEAWQALVAGELIRNRRIIYLREPC